jgi:DNA-binding winged helix-turn-helix (wHTH) protein
MEVQNLVASSSIPHRGSLGRTDTGTGGRPHGNQRSVVPTIYLVGIDDLQRIPEFLDLGLIVVVAPDPATLRRWQHEQELGEPVMDPPVAASGVVVEMAARRISYRGVPLSLSDREFRVLAGLVNGNGRAFSFEEIRRLGWGEASHVPIDIYSIRSLIQRLRAKLRALAAPDTIAPVRSYGFRLERGPDAAATGTAGRSRRASLAR